MRWSPRTVFETLPRPLKYTLVGALNTVLTWAVILAASRMLHWPYVGANCLGFLAGILNSYLWNRHWTFRSSEAPRSAPIRFFAVTLAVYLAQLGLLTALVECLHVPKDAAQAGAVAAGALISYLLHRRFTFRTR